MQSLPVWIVNLIVTFLVRQWAKFGASIDFAKFEATMIERLTAILPSWLDADGTAFVKALVEGAKAVVGNTAAIDNIIRLAAAEKWNEAGAAMAKLLIGAWVPTDPAGQQLHAQLQVAYAA